MIAFFVGVYVGGMITETVISLYQQESTFGAIKAAVIWPISTIRALISMYKNKDLR